jgi:hypothetical protein
MCPNESSHIQHKGDTFLRTKKRYEECFATQRRQCTIYCRSVRCGHSVTHSDTAVCGSSVCCCCCCYRFVFCRSSSCPREQLNNMWQALRMPVLVTEFCVIQSVNFLTFDTLAHAVHVNCQLLHVSAPRSHPHRV